MLHQLRGRLHDELRLAATRTREFDARLTPIEAIAGSTPELSAKLVQEGVAPVSGRARRSTRDRAVAVCVRQRTRSYGQRRGEALADLYGGLARVESALASIVEACRCCYQGRR